MYSSIVISQGLFSHFMFNFFLFFLYLYQWFLKFNTHKKKRRIKKRKLFLVVMLNCLFRWLLLINCYRYICVWNKLKIETLTLNDHQSYSFVLINARCSFLFSFSSYERQIGSDVLSCSYVKWRTSIIHILLTYNPHQWQRQQQHAHTHINSKKKKRRPTISSFLLFFKFLTEDDK